MKLRGTTIKGDFYYFDLGDCPVSLNDSQTILMNKPGSPILLTKSIVRGSDDGLLFEFDFLLTKELKFIGFIVYQDGFYAYHIDKDILTPIRTLDGYRVESNKALWRSRELEPRRSYITFNALGYIATLGRISYCKDGNLYTDLKSYGRSVPVDSLDFCIGSKHPDKELYYNQPLEDGIIVMNEYHPMVKLFDGSYRELEDRDYESMGITKRIRSKSNKQA